MPNKDFENLHSFFGWPYLGYPFIFGINIWRFFSSKWYDLPKLNTKSDGDCIGSITLLNCFYEYSVFINLLTASSHIINQNNLNINLYILHIRVFMNIKIGILNENVINTIDFESFLSHKIFWYFSNYSLIMVWKQGICCENLKIIIKRCSIIKYLV